MILDGDQTASGATLDELFRRAGVRSPRTLALADPPNRASFTDGAPRALTYGEADRAISALAARLRGLGLQTDAVIATQLPNTVEGIITLLGVLRAGMIAAPLPLLWGQHDIVAALRGIGAKAIIACARAGSRAPAKAAMLAAAELFPIRHVCAFGGDLPDGVVPLDEIFSSTADFVHPPVRPAPAAGHVAVVTFDVTPAGTVPVARNAAQLTAAGLALSRAAALAPQANILSTIPPASFAGIALSVMPWLIGGGGTLALHQGCELGALALQAEALEAPTLVLPGPALEPLADAGRLLAFPSIVALWRAPERLASAAAWHREANLVDVASFGEIGLIAAKRAAKSAPLHVVAAEMMRTRNGTLALRGPMVAAPGFPQRVAPEPASDGVIDTAFTCAIDGDTVTITGPPVWLTAIAGYRFHQPAIEALIAEADPAATIVAVPDGLLGQRLAGRTTNRIALVAALQARGANPLIAGAFRGPGEASAA